MNEYSFVFNLCAGIENKVVDALSRITVTLHRMSAHVLGFDRLKNEYSTCPDFGIICVRLVMVNVMSMLTFLLKMLICLKLLNCAYLEHHLGIY